MAKERADERASNQYGVGRDRFVGTESTRQLYEEYVSTARSKGRAAFNGDQVDGKERKGPKPSTTKRGTTLPFQAVEEPVQAPATTITAKDTTITPLAVPASHDKTLKGASARFARTRMHRDGNLF